MSSPRSPNLEKSVCSNKEPKTNKQKLKKKKKKAEWSGLSVQNKDLHLLVVYLWVSSSLSHRFANHSFIFYTIIWEIIFTYVWAIGRKGSGSDFPDNLSLVLFKNIFIYFWLCWVGLHCCSRAFFSCGKQGLLSSCSVQASRRSGFCWCRGWALGMRASVAAALRLRFWHRDLAASGRVGSNLCPLHWQVDS